MRTIPPTALLLAALLAGLPAAARADADPVFTPGGPDAASYGQAADYPVGGRTPPTQALMVGSYSHYDRIWPFHRVAAAAAPMPLARAGQPLALSYPYRGSTHTLDDYLAHNPVTGLLIAHDDRIVFEHYQYGRTDHDRMLSQSMAKTIVAMLLGIAIAEGTIHSVDDPAQRYVPELAGTAFGETSLRALLHMASGVAFREDYDDRTADNVRLGRALFDPSANPSARDTAHAIALFNTRVAPPDTHFNYAGVQTELLGLVLTRATGMSAAAYLQSRIWQPMGAEAEATWTVDHSGEEVAYCCFSATLRDWARLGLLLAHDGALNGHRIIPLGWLRDATTEPPDSPFAPRRATPFLGYGYQLWLFPAGPLPAGPLPAGPPPPGPLPAAPSPGPSRQFALLGIHGQSIYIDPAAHLVMVQTAVRVPATGERAEAVALWRALVAHYAE